MAKEAADKNKKVKKLTPLKRDEQSLKRNTRNRVLKSRIRTAIRSYEESLTATDKEQAKLKLNEVYSVLDKAAQKGVFKANKADRTKARLHARLTA